MQKADFAKVPGIRNYLRPLIDARYNIEGRRGDVSLVDKRKYKEVANRIPSYFEANCIAQDILLRELAEDYEQDFASGKGAPFDATYVKKLGAELGRVHDDASEAH